MQLVYAVLHNISDFRILEMTIVVDINFFFKVDNLIRYIYQSCLIKI